MTSPIRYAYVRIPGHPLNPPSGQLPEHRVILYAKIGPGAHPCHHCGTVVEWRVGMHTEDGCLVTDHLDSDFTNNDPANLVPSCQPCNLAKNSRAILPGELFLVMKDGKRARAEERVCRVCEQPFLVRVAEVRASAKAGRIHFGLFCSRSCARSTPRK